MEGPIFVRYLHTTIYKNKPRVSRWEKLKLKVAHKTGPTFYFLGSKGKSNKRREWLLACNICGQLKLFIT